MSAARDCCCHDGLARVVLAIALGPGTQAGAAAPCCGSRARRREPRRWLWPAQAPRLIVLCIGTDGARLRQINIPRRVGPILRFSGKGLVLRLTLIAAAVLACLAPEPAPAQRALAVTTSEVVDAWTVACMRDLVTEEVGCSMMSPVEVFAGQGWQGAEQAVMTTTFESRD